MIKRGLQTLITKVSLQRLPNFAGRHEDHYFPPVWEPESAQLGDDLWPLRWRRLPSKKGDVRSIHIADKNSRVPHSKGRQNPLLHLHPGGRCECKNRGRAESFPNLPQTTVFGPKVAAPLVDAMGLVDYKERRSDRPEHLEFALVPDKEPFRRRIKKLEARLRQEPIAEPLIVAIEITVDEGGGYLEPEESGDLFSHQRLQGRDNDAHPLSQDGRQLKAQGLTETRRADHEHRLSAQSRLDHGQLAVSETLQPEETEDGSEVAARVRYCALSIKPQREPHGPAFHHTARKSPGKFWMMRGMAPVTQGHEVRRLICSARGSRKQVMHICVSVAAPSSALNASVVVAEEHALSHPGPVGRSDNCR